MTSSRAGDGLPIHQGPSAGAYVSSTATGCRKRTKYMRAVGLALSFASMALASPIEELPVPTAVANLRLAPLDGTPQPTSTPDPLLTTHLMDELLMDTRIPFRDDEGWKLLHPAEHELRRRAASGSATTTLEIPISTASSESSAKASESETASTTESSSKTSTSSSSASSSTATAETSPLPTFFDGGLSNNFTDASCPTFIDNMISDEEFNACYPVSLLLQVRSGPP